MFLRIIARISLYAPIAIWLGVLILYLIEEHISGGLLARAGVVSVICFSFGLREIRRQKMEQVAKLINNVDKPYEKG